MHLRHIAARFMRSARVMPAAGAPHGRCRAPQRRVFCSATRQRTSWSPAALLRSTSHRRPLFLPPLLRTATNLWHCRADATSAGAADGDQLEEAVEVDVLIEGDPLPSQRRVPRPRHRCRAEAAACSQSVLCGVPVFARPLIGSPVNFVDCLIGSPISSQSTAPSAILHP